MLQFLETLLSFLFPKRCVLCKTEGKRLCVLCEKTLSVSTETPEPWIMSIFSYRDPKVRLVLKIFKYKHDEDCALFFGSRAKDLLLEEITDQNMFQKRNVVLIPIPMSRKRIRVREKNSAELFARNIYKALPFTEKEIALDLLSKIKETKPQTKTKNRTERLYNLSGSFVARATPKESLYVLVDDVTTTGTTLREARKVLEKSGAQHILAITIAH